MAKIYISYNRNDEALAKDIELQFQKCDHIFTYGVGTLPIGDWRKKLLIALRSAEVVIPILSKNGLNSHFVVSEVGSARAYDDMKGMLLVPILFGENSDVPLFVSDYRCYYLSSHDGNEISALVNEINKAISQHLDELSSRPRIFISHRHKDESITEALIDLLESAFYIEKKDIRCTSVQPYTLTSGERTSERLRAEISSAEVVIGLLTPDTKESNYVVAELGGAWGCNIPTFPLLARGATFEHVPEPLNERHSLSLQKESDCFQLIDDIARMTSLRRKTDVSGRIAKEVKFLTGVASEISATAT
jgi:hypothetical protein